MHRLLWIAAALIAAVLLVSGCGGSSENSAATGSGESTSAETRDISQTEANELVASGSLGDWNALSVASKQLVVNRYASVAGDEAPDESASAILIAGIDGAASVDGPEAISLRAALDETYPLVASALGGPSFDTEACSAELGDLISSLEEIDGRLDVGMPYAAYSDRVGDASVAYNRIDFKSLEAECIQKVGLFVEQGLNRYLKAENRWSACIDDYACDTDSIEPALQRHWAQASKLIDRARGALA